jgi:preprotein translocase subunit SecE
VARDRQRAKQRKARRAQNPGGPARSQPYRADLPGELEHSSGEVDEFEAALVAGADGKTVDDVDEQEDPEVSGRAVDEQEDVEAAPQELRDEAAPEELSDEEFDELEDEVEDATLDEEEAVEGRTPARREAAAAPGAATRRGPGRFVGFLRASWAELQRVQWPDRRQVAQATGVVIGFVIIAGLYLGVADWVAKQVVNAII